MTISVISHSYYYFAACIELNKILLEKFLWY